MMVPASGSRHHGARGGLSHGAGSGSGLDAAQTPHPADDDSEHQALGQPPHEVGHAGRRHHPVHERDEREAQRGEDQGSAHEPGQAGHHGEDRDDEHGGQDPGHDQEAHGLETHGRERIELFVHLHGSDLGGEGGAGAGRQQDGGHERSQLSKHGDPQEIRGEDLGPEALHGDGGLEQQDQAQQEAHDGHDGDRADAGPLGHEQEVLASDQTGTPQHVAHGDHELPQEDEEGSDVRGHLKRGPTQGLEEVETMLGWLRLRLAGPDHLQELIELLAQTP
jgi:hypothetical protein